MFEFVLMIHKISRWLHAGILASVAFGAYAQTAADPDPIEARTTALEEIVPAIYDGDVRDLQQVTYPLQQYWHLLNEREEPYRLKPQPAPANAQEEMNAPLVALAPMPAPSKNFAGLGFSTPIGSAQAGAGWPPDINGDVGPTYYVQAVNDAFGVFDKNTGSLITNGAFTENQLWSISNSPCNGSSAGDPVVLHDGLADRWILTNFAFAFDTNGNPVAPFYECIAVSRTSNPVTGGWYLYAVRMDTGAVPTGTLNDYPKFGLWTDCLYMGANGFDETQSPAPYVGAIFATFSRAALFAGQMLTTTNSSVGFLGGSSPPFSMFPANLLGTASAAQPPSGTPEYFVSKSRSAFAFDVRKYTQGANVCGVNASGGLSTATSVALSQYDYPGTGSGSTFTTDIVGQGGGTANTLDSLGDRIMQKVQYRKVGTAESLWVVHTTCGSPVLGSGGVCASSTTTTRPQWMQINVTGKTISSTPVQQQIYSPDSTLYRWMPSLAVDANGDMALGYSTSSTSAFPAIAYSGRLVGDTLNQLPQTETVLQAGSASQTNSLRGSFVSRWGDYSSMSIDPADDCTFWYTNEYYDSATNGSSGNWQTRIGAFKFPSCTASSGGGPATSITFTTQPATNSNIAAGANFSVVAHVADASGGAVAGQRVSLAFGNNAGSGGLTGSGPIITDASGNAAFSPSIDKAGIGYTLKATTGTLSVTSNPFNIVAGAANKITFTMQPMEGTNIAAGATFSLTAHVQDTNNNAIANQNVSIAFGNNAGGGTLHPNASPQTTDASGNVTFIAWIDKIGTGYTVNAIDNSTPLSVVSNAFNIVAGAATQITFTTQPAANSGVDKGVAFPLAVHVQDTYANPVPGQSISLAFGNSASGSSLTVNANPQNTDTNGDVAFNASIDKTGACYTLIATDNSTGNGTTPVTGNKFNVVANDALLVNGFETCQ